MPERNLSPYGSVRDLPSVVEMETQLRGLGVFALIIPKVKRSEVKRLRAEFERIVVTVDRFYALLGPRNWVFTDDLNMPAMEHVVDTDDPVVAEARLLEHFRAEDRLSFPAGQLHRFEQMRSRMHLIEHARRDYEAARYYSCVLVLITVMDGFVNDFEKDRRKGLHSRSAEEMAAWDSVVGHHLGLSNAHKTFMKSFKKLDESEVTDLFRHGIVHGMLPNFNNELVAAKAWNRLFAVGDWADARIKELTPPKPEPTWRDLLSRIQDTALTKKRLDHWSSHEYDADGDDEWGVVATCEDFLGRWSGRQWAPLGQHFIQFGSDPVHVGRLALDAKSMYERRRLSEWKLLRVHHTAAAVAEVCATGTINGESESLTLRWVRVTDSNGTACEWDSGRWVLSPTYPDSFVRKEDTDD